MQRAFEVSYDKLVVGSDLGALTCAYENDYPAIFIRSLRPYEYDKNSSWIRAQSLWNEMSYSLAMNSQFPFSNLVYSYRLEDDYMKVSTKNGVVCKVKYNELIISDDYQLEGLPPPIGKTSTKNWVLDWFDVNRGIKHDLFLIEDANDNFVTRIHFYKTKRKYRCINNKDLVSASLIDDEDLYKEEYEQNIVRMKTVNMLKTNGIKGVWDKSNKCFLPPKLTSVKRDIHPLGKNIYADIPKVRFI